MRSALLRTAAVSVAVLLSVILPVSGQSVATGVAGGGVWSDVAEQTVRARLSMRSGTNVRRDIVPGKYRTVQINKAALTGLLASAVPDTAGSVDATGVEFQIPHPRGGFHRFLVQESPIMEP